MKNPVTIPIPRPPALDRGIKVAHADGGTKAFTSPDTTALKNRKGNPSNTIERKERQTS
jgi:hypothetical protein